MTIYGNIRELRIMRQALTEHGKAASDRLTPDAFAMFSEQIEELLQAISDRERSNNALASCNEPHKP